MSLERFDGRLAPSSFDPKSTTYKVQIIMTLNLQKVRLQATYNRNKFFKQHLSADDTQIVVEACPICGGKITPVTTIENGKGEEILIRSACYECAFVTFSRMPNGETVESFYKTDWDSNRGDESIQQKIEAPYEPLFSKLLPELDNKEMRILEIGSGYGGALSQLRNLGFKNLRGIEASEKRQQVCSDQLGLNVSLTTSEKMESVPEIATGAPYDAIFSWHVIEHVFDLEETFSAISRLLRPGGVLVVGVPNFEHEHLVYLAHFLPHIHCFTEKSFVTLLMKFGFAPTYIDGQIRSVSRRTDDLVDVPNSLSREKFAKHPEC